MKKVFALFLALFAFTVYAQAPAKDPTAAEVVQAAMTSPAAQAAQASQAPVQDLLPPQAFTLPSDAIGFMGGEMHGLAKLLAALTSAMAAMRVLAEILSKVALVTGNPQAGVAAQMASTGLSYLAWFVGIFSLGAPKSIDGHKQIQAKLADVKTDTKTPGA